MKKFIIKNKYKYNFLKIYDIDMASIISSQIHPLPSVALSASVA